MRFDEGQPRPVPKGVTMPFREHRKLSSIRILCRRCGRRLEPKRPSVICADCAGPKGAA